MAADDLKLFIDGMELVDVDAGVVRRILQGGHQGGHGRLGGAQSQGGHGAVHHVSAGFDGLQVSHGGLAGGVVGVDLHHQSGTLLDGLDQLVGGIRPQQARHILDADGIGAHIGVDGGFFGESFHRVDGADSIGNGDLSVDALFLGGLEGPVHVADVVQGVEDTDDIDAVSGRALDEFVHHVVGVVPVTDQVLTAQQHLQLGLGHGLAQLAQTVPGILVQKAHAAVEGGAAPDLAGMEAYVVQHAGDLQQVVGGDAGGQQGLMAVAHRCIGDSYLSGTILRHNILPRFS